MVRVKKQELILACGQVSELGSKLASRIAQRIKHVLRFSFFLFSPPPLLPQPYHMSPHKSPSGFSDGVFLQPA